MGNKTAQLNVESRVSFIQQAWCLPLALGTAAATHNVHITIIFIVVASYEIVGSPRLMTLLKMTKHQG